MDWMNADFSHLQSHSGTKDKVKLKEFSFSTGNVTSYMDGGDVALNSSLGAWYEPASDERFVVYQEANNGRLKELSLIDRTSKFSCWSMYTLYLAPW